MPIDEVTGVEFKWPEGPREPLFIIVDQFGRAHACAPSRAAALAWIK